MWSVGTLVVTVFGASVAYLLTPSQNLLLIAALGFVAFAFSSRRLLPPSLDEHQGDGEVETKNSVPWFGLAAIPLSIMGIGADG